MCYTVKSICTVRNFRIDTQYAVKSTGATSLLIRGSCECSECSILPEPRQCACAQLRNKDSLQCWKLFLRVDETFPGKANAWSREELGRSESPLRGVKFQVIFTPGRFFERSLRGVKWVKCHLRCVIFQAHQRRCPMASPQRGEALHASCGQWASAARRQLALRLKRKSLSALASCWKSFEILISC